MLARYDYGAIILMDERFLEQRSTSGLSRWLRACIPPRIPPVGTALTDLEAFFTKWNNSPPAPKDLKPILNRSFDVDAPAGLAAGQPPTGGPGLSRLERMQVLLKTEEPIEVDDTQPAMSIRADDPSLLSTSVGAASSNVAAHQLDFTNASSGQHSRSGQNDSSNIPAGVVDAASGDQPATTDVPWIAKRPKQEPGVGKSWQALARERLGFGSQPAGPSHAAPMNAAASQLVSAPSAPVVSGGRFSFKSSSAGRGSAGGRGAAEKPAAARILLDSSSSDGSSGGLDGPPPLEPDPTVVRSVEPITPSENVPPVSSASANLSPDSTVSAHSDNSAMVEASAMPAVPLDATGPRLSDSTKRRRDQNAVSSSEQHPMKRTTPNDAGLITSGRICSCCVERPVAICCADCDGFLCVSMRKYFELQPEQTTEWTCLCESIWPWFESSTCTLPAARPADQLVVLAQTLPTPHPSWIRGPSTSRSGLAANTAVVEALYHPRARVSFAPWFCQVRMRF